MIKEALTISGWLSDIEAEFLCNCIKTLSTEGCVVEVGSWKGKSTVQIASECKISGRKFIAIDHLKGTIQQQKKRVYTNLDILMANLKRYEVDKYCEFWHMGTEDIKKWDKSIALLFHDGSHQYEDVKRDLQLFLPSIIPGGLILLHDYVTRKFIGIKKAADEMGLIEPHSTCDRVGCFKIL